MLQKGRDRMMISIPIFILAIIISVKSAIKNKNISLGRTFRKLWNYLAASTALWYLGLLVVLFIV